MRTTPSPVLSTFATSVYHLIFTHFIIGAGMGIVVVPVNVILTQYFRCDTLELGLKNDIQKAPSPGISAHGRLRLVRQRHVCTIVSLHDRRVRLAR